MKELLRIVFVLGALGVWSSAAMAQSSSDDGRSITLAPYLWGTSIDGTGAVGNLPPLEIDASFGDILSKANFAMSVHTEFRFDDWVFVVDPTYISLEIEAALPPEIPVPAGTTLPIEVDIWLVELWAGYRINENWEAIGGLRYQDQDISINGLPDPPSPVSSVEAGTDWTDWFIGARFKTDLGDKWFLTWRADVVIAGDSDTSWNTAIVFFRRIGDTMSLNLGYRYLVDDFVDPGVYGWDVTQQGPVIGYTWKF